MVVILSITLALTLTSIISTENGNSDSGTSLQLQDPVKLELAKDIAKMVIESNLGSKCKTNVFIGTEECENYESFVAISLSQWGSPVLLLKYPDTDLDTFQNLPIRKKHAQIWKHVLSRFHHPCKLVYICALIKVPNQQNNQNPTTNDIVDDFRADNARYNDGSLTFLTLFRNIDQILYLSNYNSNDENNNTTDIDMVMNDKIQFLEQSEDKVLNHTGFLLSVKLEDESQNSESLFNVFARCKYCGTNIQNRSLGTWRRNRTLFSNFFQAFDEYQKVSFENFDGFNIGYLEYPPHISCEKPAAAAVEEMRNVTIDIDNIDIDDMLNFGTEITNCSGVEWEMIKAMSKSLKFRFTLRDFTGTGQQGSVYSSHNITGMIGAVNSGQLDVAVGAISVTPDKLAYMDVTDIFTHQPIVFVVEKRNDLYILGIWLAFEPEVWPLIIATIVSVAVIVELILRRHDKSKLKKSKSIRKRRTSTIKGLEISIKSLLGQPLTSSQFPRPARPIYKLVLSLWWFACLIISTVYNTNLITSLINPVSPEEPESLANLLDSDYRFRVVSRKSAISGILNKAGDVDDEYNYPFRQIKARLIAYGDYYSPSRTAYIVEESAVDVVNWKEKYGFANIKVINERLFLTGYGWPLRRDAPYKIKFNTALSYLSAAGLINHWYETFSHKDKKPMEERFRLQEKIGQVKLDMEVLQGAFIFLVLGCFTAFLIFAYEQLSSRYTFRFFTIQEIQGFCKVLLRKVQEYDFEQEVTRVGHTGIIFVAPLESLPQRQPRQQNRFHIFGDKKVFLNYLK